MKRMIQLSMTLAVLLFLPLTVSARATPDRAAFAAKAPKSSILNMIPLSEFSETGFTKNYVNLYTPSTGISLPSLYLGAGIKGCIQTLLSPQTSRGLSWKVDRLIIINMKLWMDGNSDITTIPSSVITNIASGRSWTPKKTLIEKQELIDGSSLVALTGTFSLRKTNRHDPLVLTITQDSSSHSIDILGVEYRLLTK